MDIPQYAFSPVRLLNVNRLKSGKHSFVGIKKLGRGIDLLQLHNLSTAQYRRVYDLANGSNSCPNVNFILSLDRLSLTKTTGTPVISIGSQSIKSYFFAVIEKNNYS